jgi:hypothetical protein
MGLFNKNTATSNTAGQDVPDLQTELGVLGRMDAARQQAERTGDQRALRDINAVAQTATVRANEARRAGQR